MLDDILNTIFKNAYPDASDEDIQAQVANLKKSGSDAVNKALSFIPGASSAKDIVMNAPAMASQAMKSPAVQDAASALTGGPVSSLVPNPGNPVSDVVQGAMVGGLKQAFDPSQAKPADDTTTEQDEGPGPDEMAAGTPTIPSVDSSTPSNQGTSKSKSPASPLAQALASAPSNDNATRQAELENEKKKHALGTLPVALAGIGDAISAAAKPFGGEATTGSAGKVENQLAQGAEARKAQTETNIKNDPNSDVSKAYRQMVLTIAPELGKQANFNSMSAQEIGDKLPLIDTVMKAKATEATRQLALQQQRGIRDQGLLGKASNSYNSNDLVKKAQDTKSKMDMALDLIAQGQTMPVAPSMVGLVMAPAITGVKRFNTQELAAFGGEKDVLGRIKQAGEQMVSGKLTPENAKLLSSIATMSRQHALGDIKQQGTTIAKQLAAQTGGDWKQHYQDITGNPYEDQSTPAKAGNKDPLGIL